MTQLTRTASTVLGTLVAVLSGASTWMLASTAVSSGSPGSTSEIRDLVVWSLAAAAVLSALVAVVPWVRREIGRSVGASLTAASFFVLAMTANAVAVDRALAVPGQRSLSLLAVVFAIVGATLTALSLSPASSELDGSSRPEPCRR